MRCSWVGSRLSAWRDGELEPGQARELQDHVAACPGCAGRSRELERALDALSGLAPVAPPESIARRVLDRLEVERRGPGLALLFRPAWAARPLMLPSMLEACLIVFAVLAGVLALSTTPESVASGAVAGSAANPLAVLGDVPMPRSHADPALAERLLTSVGDGNLFVETVVAADGHVLSVRLVDGEREGAQPLLDAMMQARFEPTLYQGRHVAVSFYRLISRAEVIGSDS